jgi:hypothetical protein
VRALWEKVGVSLMKFRKYRGITGETWFVIFSLPEETTFPF